MKTDIIEAIRFCFPSKVVTQISLAVDETEQGVEKGLEKAIPLVLESLLLRADRPGGAEAVLPLPAEAYRADLLPHLPHLETTAWYAHGATLVPALAGEDYEQLVNRVATAGNIQPAAAHSLLRIAAAASLSLIGRYAAENDLTPPKLVAWLKTQRTAVTMALFGKPEPQPLLVTDVSSNIPPHASQATRSAAMAYASANGEPGSWAAVGGGSTFTPRQPPYDPVGAPAPTPAPVSGPRFNWQWPLLLLLALALGYYFGHDRLAAFSGTAAPAAPVASPAASPAPAAATGAATTAAGTAAAATATRGTYDADRDTYIYDTGQPIILTLADGSTQKVGANSTENRLYTFLADPTVQVDSVNRTKGWINFDRVYFEAGKATLTPESAQQLANIARVLKTFPTSIVKLGGYTDSTGNSLQNLLLSEQRANTAMLALARQGIDPSHLQSKGYGARYFIASNATPEGRALNRRISIRVIRK